MQIRFGIFTKIWLAMLGVVLAPLLLVWSLEYAHTLKQTRQLLEARQQGTMESLVTFVDGWVEMNRRLLTYNADLEAIRSMEASRQKPLLEAIVEHYPWNYLAFTLDTYGRNVGRSDDQAPKDYRERGYVRQIRQGKPFAYQVLIGRTSEQLSLVLAVPVKNAHQAGPGVLAIAMNAETVIERVQRARFGETGHLMLLSDNGALIASPDSSLDTLVDLSSYPAFQQYQRQGAGTYAYQRTGGTRYLATVRPTALGWLLVAEQAEQEAMAPVHEQTRTALLLLVLGVPITALVAYWVSLRLARPIHQLTEAVRDHETTGLAFQEEVLGREDEIGLLAQEIDLSYEAQGLIQQLLSLTLRDAGLDSVLQDSLRLILRARWFRDAPRGGIWLEEQANELRLRIQYELPVQLLGEMRKLGPDHPLYRHARQGEIFVDPVRETPMDQPEEVRYQVPIIGNQGCIGLLMLYQRVTGYGRETELNFLKAVSQTLGGVIERKRAEEALSKSQATLEAIIDNSSAIVSVKDIEGRYLLVNRRFEEVFGLLRDEVIGATDLECHSRVLARAWGRTDQEVLETGTTLEYQEEFSLDGLVLTYLTVKFPLRDTQGKTYALCRISTDVTRLKSVEQELRSLNAELEARVKARTQALQESLEKLRQAQQQLVQSEKMAALGNLVTGVAHEINTPLGVSMTAASHIQDASQSVAERYRQQELGRQALERYFAEVQEASGLLLNNLEQASELVSSFKQVAVSQSGEEAQVFDLRRCLEETLAELEPQLRSKQVEAQIHGLAPLEIESVPGVFSQILTHLVVNALVHGFKDRERGVIDITLNRTEHELEWLVSDNGRGMDDEQLAHLFEPFYTTRRGQGGTGLGMHLVYNLVHQVLRGQIECHSAPGQGVQYRIRIPWESVARQAASA